MSRSMEHALLPFSMRFTCSRSTPRSSESFILGEILCILCFFHSRTKVLWIEIHCGPLRRLFLSVLWDWVKCLLFPKLLRPVYPEPTHLRINGAWPISAGKGHFIGDFEGWELRGNARNMTLNGAYESCPPLMTSRESLMINMNKVRWTSLTLLSIIVFRH